MDVLAFLALHPGMMIRCGKPELETLMRFTEKASPLEAVKRDVLSKRLAVQRKAKNASKDWLALARSLYVNVSSVSYTHDG